MIEDATLKLKWQPQYIECAKTFYGTLNLN